MLGGISLSSWMERQAERDSPLRKAELLRGEVREAREAWEGCLDTLAVMERRFRTQARETEALGEQIRALEGLDPRGVPADRYEGYLDAVDRFNAGITAWGAWAVALERRQAECRGLIEARNVLADSLRLLLEEAGYLPSAEGAPEGAPEDTSRAAPRDTLPPSSRLDGTS